MKNFFEKFPSLNHQGRRIIWDSRQNLSSPEAKLVFLSPEILENSEVSEKLLAAVNADFVVPQGNRKGREVADVAAALASASADALSHPSLALRVWGVTGTNGKSSCVEILRHALISEGRSVLQIGTLGISFWKGNASTAIHREETGYTTPLAPQLQYLLHRAVEEGVQDVVMEVSSHALEERRADCVDFDAALFTNLSHDHLDFHGSMDRYFESKKSFFTRLLSGSRKLEKFAVVNRDDPYGHRLLHEISSQPFIHVGISTAFDARLRKKSIRGMEFSWTGVGDFQTKLVGSHNLENLMLCLAALRGMGRLPVKKLQMAATDFPGVRGRLERIGPEGPFVFVDYAHSPDALEKVLKTLSGLRGEGARLAVVFGCGGDRDTTKRPEMGRIAAQYADIITLTSDNPRTEDPAEILKQIYEGVPQSGREKVNLNADRAIAIQDTLRKLEPIDVCLIAGKGHETYQIIGSEKRAFDDADVVRSFFRGL